MTLALHWFRTDLRMHDNLALAAARAEGSVAAIYIATPGQWQMHDDAAIKQDFWRRNLQELEAALDALNIPLCYFEVADYKEVPALLENVLPHWKVSALHYNREYPLNERRRDIAVADLCNSLGVRIQIHDDQVLMPPDSVMNKSGQPFKVFTPFARHMRELLQPLAGLQMKGIKQQAPLSLKRLNEQCELRELSWPSTDPVWEKLWPAGEKHARKRLKEFCEGPIVDYADARNIPSIDGTSRLSPALAAGVISIRECWQAAQGEGDVAPGENKNSEIWRNELLWRDFYKHIIWHYPHVNQHKPWRADVAHVPWQHDKNGFASWCDGQTGIPIVDAGMRQLKETGWMHNRLRMLTAMFLSKHLLIDWRWGERWFMQHLIDGDFAANNGGWQWSASTGTDAVPYFRIFNPVTQSRRFDPDGTYLRRYVPELADLDHATIHDPGILRPAAYPAPMIELSFGRERALRAFKKRTDLSDG
ncbi:MAG: FAD-binding domain-containing protein [Pseudomonadota bacterium]